MNFIPFTTNSNMVYLYTNNNILLIVNSKISISVKYVVKMKSDNDRTTMIFTFSISKSILQRLKSVLITMSMNVRTRAKKGENSLKFEKKLKKLKLLYFATRVVA